MVKFLKEKKATPLQGKSLMIVKLRFLVFYFFVRVDLLIILLKTKSIIYRAFFVLVFFPQDHGLVFNLPCQFVKPCG